MHLTAITNDVFKFLKKKKKKKTFSGKKNRVKLIKHIDIGESSKEKKIQFFR